MKTSQKVTAGIGALVLALAASVSVVAIANPAVPVDDAPAKVVQEQKRTADIEPEVTPEPTQEPVAPAPAPEPAPEPAPVAPPPPPPAPAPAKCPPGSTVNEGDGDKHISCFPNECYTAPSLPDPAYPQCVAPFKP